MTRKTKTQFKNQLALARGRKLIEQKQVAVLLGHKSIDQISRYERGIKLPSLKAALKLGLIYKIPIRILLDGYFDACREEIKRQEGHLGKTEAPQPSTVTDEANESEFCTIEQKLRSEKVSRIDVDKAYSHSVALIRQRAEKLGHI